MKDKAIREAAEQYAAKIAGSIATEEAADALDRFMDGETPDDQRKAAAWEEIVKQQKKKKPPRIALVAAIVVMSAFLLGGGVYTLYDRITRETSAHTDSMAVVMPEWFGYSISVPEGYVLEEEVQEGASRELYFGNSAGDYISVCYYDSGLSNSLDNETEQAHSGWLSHGVPVSIYVKNDVWKLVWYQDDKTFVLRCSVSQELAIEVAESVRKK